MEVIYDKKSSLMENLVGSINEAVDFIRSKTDFKPQYGLILGTGLGGLAKEIEVEYELEYKDIPFFPASTVETRPANSRPRAIHPARHEAAEDQGNPLSSCSNFALYPCEYARVEKLGGESPQPLPATLHSMAGSWA